MSLLPCSKKRRIASPDSWSYLKLTSLETVLKKLSYVDVFSFESPCSVVPSSYPPKQPVLALFPSTDKEEDADGNGDDDDDIFFNFGKENSSDGYCVGSSHGWLIVLDEKTNLFMFNLFARDRVGVELPSPTTIPGVDINGLRGYRWIIKSILTRAPTASGDYGVVAICGVSGFSSQLVYAMSGDTQWTKLKGLYNCYSDIICHKNHLYALSEDNALEVWEFKRSVPIKTMVIEPEFPEKLVEFENPSRDLYSSQVYLVESFGEILLVVRIIGNLVKEEDGVVVHEADLLDDEEFSHLNCVYRTTKFYVYKLDLRVEKWVRVESLGDKMLFLGLNQSISLSAQDFLGSKPNSIYFTDDFWDGMKVFDTHAGHDMGVFELDSGNITQIYPSDTKGIKEPLFWVVNKQGGNN